MRYRTVYSAFPSVILVIVMAMTMVAVTSCTSMTPAAEEQTGATQPVPATPSQPALTAEAEQSASVPTATVTSSATLPATDTPAAEPTPTTAATPIATAEPTAVSPPIPVTTPVTTTGLTVTHQDIDRFHDIPDEYITAAAQLTWLFRHASVGVNIQDGLECLMNNFERRPHRCDRDLPAAEIVYDSKYDHRNWQFEFHNPPPGQNPGWWNKVGYFIERMNSLTPDEQYDYVSFKMGYVDAGQGSNISLFFIDDADANLPDYRDIEALQAQLGDTEIIWWTLGLARLSYIESREFNEQLRTYVATNGGILMDIADIMSHTPDGEPCYDNAGNGIIALCPEYTDEVNAGHLNATGRLRMAKAMWVLMARLAGWEG
ncbi:MAG: hypothetical protein R6X32_04480 [Chloroflexota bacterium]